MKIVVISGSPHADGTSAVLVEAFIKGAEEAGHEIYRFDAAFKEIHPCIACEKCQGEERTCVFRDDMDELNLKIIEADVVVFASPIYYNDICGQLKIVIDRFFAQDEKFIGKKSTALLLAFGDGTMDTANGAIMNFKATAEYFKWEIAGIIAGMGCSAADDIRKTDFPKKAYILGKNIKM